MPYISNKNLIVSAEQMDSNERITGYVCACAFCLESHNNRPTGLLTTPDGLNGGIRVFLDTMYFESPTEPISLYDSFVLKTDTSHDEKIRYVYHYQTTKNDIYVMAILLNDDTINIYIMDEDTENVIDDNIKNYVLATATEQLKTDYKKSLEKQ